MTSSQIHSLRKSLGMSVREFAAALGYSPCNGHVSVYRLENGDRRPSQQTILLSDEIIGSLLANFLQVSDFLCFLVLLFRSLDFFLKPVDLGLGCGNVTKLFKNMVTASEGLIVYEALQIAKAAGIDYKAALDLMTKTKSQNILDRWETRFDLSGGDLKFNVGTNLYDKDLPLAAEVGKALGAAIPVTEQLAALGIRLNGGKCSI